VSLLYQSTVMGTTRSPYVVREFTVATRFFKRMLVLLLCSFAVAAMTLRFVSIVEAAKVVTPAVPVVTPTAQVVAAPAAAPAPTPTASAPAVSTPTCTPYGVVASPAPLTMTAPGLQQVVDSPTTYRIYGASTAAVAAQLRRCAPVSAEGNFSAMTSYWIGARYGFTRPSADTCQLSSITVAVHVTQVLPTWQNSGNSALAAKWSAYEHNLTIHENGHTVINISQASTLLDELSQIPAQPCDQIAATAKAVMSARLAALDKANDDYDASTGHGATQGASW
jgi:predicted secreted Zn-dependent protease